MPIEHYRTTTTPKEARINLVMELTEQIEATERLQQQLHIERGFALQSKELKSEEHEPRATLEQIQTLLGQIQTLRVEACVALHRAHLDDDKASAACLKTRVQTLQEVLNILNKEESKQLEFPG